MKLDLLADDVQPVAGGELIPDGSFVKVTMVIRPGGVDGLSDLDKGLLKASKAPGSDVLALDCEFTVTDGRYAGRKFRQLFTVAGGNDTGASIGWTISKWIFRAMIDSAFGLGPADMSEVAKAKRQLRGLLDLNGITFVAKVAVAPNRDPRYPDRNRLDPPVLPTEKEWRAVMNGEHVPPRPSNPVDKSRGPRAPASATVGASFSQRSAGSSASAQQPATPPAAQSAPSTKPAGPAWLND